jgi:hypothetical protein
MTTSAEYKWWWPKFYKQNTSVQYYGEAVTKAQEVWFSISEYYMCEYSSQ